MTKANNVAREALIRQLEAAYALLRKELKAAARDCFARSHMARDGFCGNGYEQGVENAFDRINADWPEYWAWYSYEGNILPTWINRVTGENSIQSEIDYWNKD